jgi:chaperonin GroES
MTVRPLQDGVLVRRVQPAGDTGIANGSGIALPEAAQQWPMEGEVVAAALGGRYALGVLRALEIRAGDRVLFGQGAGVDVRRNGEKLVALKEADVMGVYRATAKKQAA